MTEERRCGLVALAGRPNVGKSTLLNYLVGQKLAITSRRPQTTRHKLVGIGTDTRHQILFTDVPGLQRRVNKHLDHHMNEVATEALADANIILMLVDRIAWSEADDFVLRKVKQAKTPAFLVINKIDLLRKKGTLLSFIEARRKEAGWQEIVPISALKNIGLLALKAAIVKRLPVSPHLFSADKKTDRSKRFLVSEFIREQIIRQTGDEVPYQTAVEVEGISEDEEKKILHINALVIVAKQGQKAILIGRGGQRLKQIGQRARVALEQLLGRRVMLRLWIKVKANWQDYVINLETSGYGE